MRTQILSPSGARPTNLAVNGAMDFWQRIVGAANNFTAASGAFFSADRIVQLTAGPTAKNFSAQRSTSVPPAALVGTPPAYSCQTNCTTTVASPAAADRWFAYRYTVEDVDMREAIQLGYLTIAFEFFATTAGNYPWRGYNFTSNRSYVSTFAYTTPNVWEQIVIQVPLEAAGTPYHFGFYIEHSGSTFQTASLNTWLAGDISTPSSGIVNLYTNGLTTRLTNLSVFAGKVYPLRNNYYRRTSSLTEELALCQRYFQKTYFMDDIYGTNIGNGRGELTARIIAGTTSNNDMLAEWSFAVVMRAIPSVSLFAPQGNQNQWRRDSGDFTGAVVHAGNVSERGTAISNQSATNTAFHRIHAIADAEF